MSAPPTSARAAVLAAPDAPLAIEHRRVPEPRSGELLLRVKACGVCHSEVKLMHGGYPFARYPTVPGHEIAATIAAHGADTEWPPIGTRVGIPFLFSSCGRCDRCVRGAEILCDDKQVTGISVDGGYQEYMLAPASSVTPLPDGIDDIHVASMMCAGLTAFNGLRLVGIEPGQRVAIIGTGGVGHLAIRFARAMGARVCAVTRSRSDVEDVPQHEVEHVIVGDETEDLGVALSAWEGGADVILNTAPVTAVANDAIPGLAPDGTLMMLGYDDQPIQIAPLPFILARARVMGAPSGSRHDLRDTLAFAAAHGIEPAVTAVVPLERASEALATMERGEMRGRTVIELA